MDIKFRYLPDSPPVFDTARARARWAAAKADYLAGAGGPEVCERHGLKLSTFRWRAKQEGWRRADQPTPFIAPDPAPTQQNDPLVIPEAPQGAIRDAPPLTAAQMADKAWAMLQAAVATGRLIEARGWMRLYKDLKPFAREEQEAERRARMDREKAERREQEDAADLPSRPPQGRAPDSAVDTGAFPTRTLDVRTGELEARADLAQTARRDDEVRPQLDCFSPSESNTPGPGAARPPPPSPSGLTGE